MPGGDLPGDLNQADDNGEGMGDDSTDLSGEEGEEVIDLTGKPDEEVIKIIRAAKSPDEARQGLIERFSLSDIQSRAIVDMRLRHLTGLEQDKLRAEYDDIMKLINHLFPSIL